MFIFERVFLCVFGTRTDSKTNLSSMGNCHAEALEASIKIKFLN